MAFLDKFRRITTTGDYFAEIDGLRFIAIFTVILFHMKTTVDMFTVNAGFIGRIFKPIFDNGWQGVELFFAISGFIIGLPFAKQYIGGRKPIHLKSYFIRRLTRLEPPYMIAIIGYTLISICLSVDNPDTKIPGLFASMFYVNNIVFNVPEYYPIGVVWSLEIEIQFYILAILFTKVYKLSKFSRRSILLSVIYGFPVLNEFFAIKRPTLYTYIHFFFIGLLLADLYLDSKKISLPKVLSIIIGGASFLGLLYINHGINLENKFIFITAILVFYYLAMHDSIWKKIMSIKVIAYIGGMCYSIYLLHTIVIGAYKGMTYGILIADSYMITLVVNTILSSIAIVIVSGFYFLLIEKPCMDKNWVFNLINLMRSKLYILNPIRILFQRIEKI
jgi:peptidoglycan/LPS O-acetylase OafA/YrhL